MIEHVAVEQRFEFNSDSVPVIINDIGKIAVISKLTSRLYQHHVLVLATSFTLSI